MENRNNKTAFFIASAIVILVFSCSQATERQDDFTVLKSLSAFINDSIKGDIKFVDVSIEENQVYGLQLENLYLKKIPLEIYKFKDLKHLSLNNNNLDSDFIYRFPQLLYLDISSNKFHKMPDFRGANRLQKLIFFGNRENIDSAIIALPVSIEWISFASNQFNFLKIIDPESLVNLRTIDISSNNLTDINESLFKLPNLKRLIITGNSISESRIIALKSRFKDIEIENEKKLSPAELE